uniref:Peptidase A2 domain-containing protein n=1 Tax=Haemonchus contortus TaxID=6289 RepID=A0A7I4Z5T4_HAECO
MEKSITIRFVDNVFHPCETNLRKILKEEIEHESAQPEPPTAHQNTPKGARRAPQRKSKPAQAHLLETASCACKTATLQEEKGSSNTVPCTIKKGNSPDSISKETRSEGKSVLLLTGVARVKDSSRNLWKDVEVLLDTGADQYFISRGLAEELGLICEGQKSFEMYTFGTETPRKTTCGETWLELWDHEGVKHELRLYTIPVLNVKGKATRLATADLDYIARHRIPLSKKNFDHTSKPQILLGCDQLWNFLDVPYSRHTLPSGLQLVPSRLGYLLTGRQMEMIQQRDPTDSIDADMAIFANSFANFDEELERWDKYWTMDSAGVCEFTGTKNAEKDAINAKVAKFFEDTIENAKTVTTSAFLIKEIILRYQRTKQLRSKD